MKLFVKSMDKTRVRTLKHDLVTFLIWAVVVLANYCGVEGELFEHQPRKYCIGPSPEQRSCGLDLLHAYPECSMSVTNTSAADTYFFLYTRRNPEHPEFLHLCGGGLPPGSHFDPKGPTRIFLHGFGDSMTSKNYQEIKDELLKREDCNLILVDSAWNDLGLLGYGACIDNGKGPLSCQICHVIENIQKATGASWESFHLIGHSLGAQIAGFVGQKCKVGRITGLDPAAPGFQTSKTDIDDRLDRTDAKLVDIIHTGCGDCLPFLGNCDNLGHVDFYVNGGSVQRTCVYGALTTLMKNDLGLFVQNVVPHYCYHALALELFKVSINPGDCLFVGVRCDSHENCRRGYVWKDCGTPGSRGCAIMGFDLERTPMLREMVKRAPNMYYVETADRCPYCDNSKIKLHGFPVSCA